MAVYQGIVKGNVVVLPEDVQLDDGARVEIRTLPEDDMLTEEELREELFRNDLAASGLLYENKRIPRQEPEGDRTPIQVEGETLSQMIIRERR